MEHGDIITKGEQWYVVVQVTGDGFARLADTEKKLVIVAEDDPDVSVFANPYRQWPFITLPHRFYRLGALRSAGRPNIVTGDVAPLRLYQDYLLGEPTRNGGALYLNPRLRLQHLDRVVLAFANGPASVIVPKRFLPVAQKAAAARFSTAVQKQQKTFYDHLLADDDEE